MSRRLSLQVLKSTKIIRRSWSPACNKHQQTREIHFVPLLGLWAAKHVSAWTIYNACKTYGWPKTYRRLLEQNRSLGNDRAVQRAIRMAIESPPRFAAKASEQMQVLIPLVEDIAKKAPPKLPSFLVAFATYLLRPQKPVKLMQDLVKAVGYKSVDPAKR